MEVIFKYPFFDGRNRFKAGRAVLPDDYPREILPKSAKVKGEEDDEPELDLKKAAPRPPAVAKPAPSKKG